MPRGILRKHGRGVRMKSELSAAAALAAAMAFAPQAYADQVAFAFGGAGYAGGGILTTELNVAPPDPNPLCGTVGENPCRTDPPGAWKITGITGTFTDTHSGISMAAITGLVPIDPANERDTVFDHLVPSSLSFIDFGTGVNAGALTYNNLYFPKGSPIDCDYPFSGTFLDVFGMAFKIAGGETVNVWGDGDVPGFGLTYGVGVTDGKGELSYAFQGVNAIALPVPEPGTFALLSAGLIGMFVWRKRSPGFADKSA